MGLCFQVGLRLWQVWNLIAESTHYGVLSLMFALTFNSIYDNFKTANPCLSECYRYQNNGTVLLSPASSPDDCHPVGKDIYSPPDAIVCRVIFSKIYAGCNNNFPIHRYCNWTMRAVKQEAENSSIFLACT